MKTAEEAGLVVQPGRARINVIDVLYDTPDLLVVEIDMNSKYVQPVVAYGDTDNGASEIWLWTDGNSLHLDETADKDAMILLPDRTAGWSVMADGGRYTIRIVAWKYPEMGSEEAP